MNNDHSLFAFFNEIGIISQLAGNLFERVMPKGMTLAQFTVLNHLVVRGGDKSPAALASAFQVTRGTMTSTLQKLSAKAFIDITPDSADARGKRVSITALGRTMRDRCIAALEPEMMRLGPIIDTHDMGPLTERLRMIRQILDKDRD